MQHYAVNLRRLFAWHLQSNKDVSRVLGASEGSISGWVMSVRSPGLEYLKKIGALYGVDPFSILGDPDAFGAQVADPERYHAAEERIAELQPKRPAKRKRPARKSNAKRLPAAGRRRG